jgi:hypothetical protein
VAPAVSSAVIQLGKAVTEATVQADGACAAAVSNAQNVEADTFQLPSTSTAVPTWLAAAGTPLSDTV